MNTHTDFEAYHSLFWHQYSYLLRGHDHHVFTHPTKNWLCGSCVVGYVVSYVYARPSEYSIRNDIYTVM